MNFITGHIESRQSVAIHAGETKSVLPFTGEIDPKYAGAEITIGARPQQIKISRTPLEQACVPGSIKIIEFQGEFTVLTIKLNDRDASEVKAVVQSSEKYSSNEPVWLHVNPDMIHLFDKDTPILRRRSN
jgi:ABC-type sugar transport system ATPase subunit